MHSQEVKLTALTDVQDIFSTLPNTGDAKDYKKAIDVLNAYFVPKVDTMYARYCIRYCSHKPLRRQFDTWPLGSHVQ